MAVWLLPADAANLMGKESEILDDARWAGACAAAIAYVERKRADLFPADEVTVGGDIKYGTALLASRYYERVGSPGGVTSYNEYTGSILRHDPDIPKLLGIGEAGAFVFGAAGA